MYVTRYLEKPVEKDLKQKMEDKEITTKSPDSIGISLTPNGFMTGILRNLNLF